MCYLCSQDLESYLAWVDTQLDFAEKKKSENKGLRHETIR